MISDLEKKSILRLLAGGRSQRETAVLLFLDRKTIARVIARKTNRRKPRPTSAPVKARRAEVKRLASKRSGKQCVPYPTCRTIRDALPRQFHPRSTATIRRDLIAMSYKSYVRCFVPSADNDVLRKRVICARALCRIPAAYLRFSDESIFTADNKTTRRQWVTRKRDILPRQRQQRGACAYVLVWGIIGIGFKSELKIWRRVRSENDDGKTVYAIPRMTADSYKRQCLSRNIAHLQHPHVFIQDGARPHTAATTLDYLRDKNVKTFTRWSPYSPDMNAIEHVWALMKPLVAARAPKDEEALVRAVRAVWNEFPQDTIDHLILAQRKVLKRIIETQGQYD
jgi:transposase